MDNNERTEAVEIYFQRSIAGTVVQDQNRSEGEITNE
jgi:hypothetical protein